MALQPHASAAASCDGEPTEPLWHARPQKKMAGRDGRQGPIPARRGEGQLHRRSWKSDGEGSPASRCTCTVPWAQPLPLSSQGPGHPSFRQHSTQWPARTSDPCAQGRHGPTLSSASACGVPLSFSMTGVAEPFPGVSRDRVDPCPGSSFAAHSPASERPWPLTALPLVEPAELQLAMIRSEPNTRAHSHSLNTFIAGSSRQRGAQGALLRRHAPLARAPGEVCTEEHNLPPRADSHSIHTGNIHYRLVDSQ